MGIFEALYGGIGQGLLWAMLALGVYLTFRILDFPDLTAEGTLALGCAVAMKLLNAGVSPVIGTLATMLIGASAGLCTALLHTKLKVPAILSGILTMISLYSINIRIMGGSTSLSIEASQSILAPIKNVFIELGMSRSIATHTATIALGVVTCTLAIFLLYRFFGTQIGAAMRATGCNEKMCRALGIDTDATKILTLVLSNSLIALAGALVSQQMSYGGTSVGTGAIVIGLAAIILGETFIKTNFPFWVKLTFVALGSVIYYMIITVIIFYGFLRPTDTKILTAVMVVAAITIPGIKKSMQGRTSRRRAPLLGIRKKHAISLFSKF